MKESRYFALFRDGVRIGRRFYIVRFGRKQCFGLGLIWTCEPFGKLSLTVGPWVASVALGAFYVGKMADILKDDEAGDSL
jgi:hypothetical protein